MPCNEEDFIITDYGKIVCIKCGKVQEEEPLEDVDFGQNFSIINKTNISYSSKTKALSRIHKWLSYDYYENRNNDLKKYIEQFKLERKLKDLVEYIFFEKYNKIRTRGKIKKGLICYSVIRAHVIKNKPFDFKEWFTFFKITHQNYNNAVSKLSKDFLFYPKDIDYYMKITDNKLDKNEVIIEYNSIIERIQNKKFNTKTLLSYVVYHKLKDLNLLEDYKKFFKNWKKIEKIIFK